ncbi:Methionine aminopeptidase [Sandaracinus amylolyticus]|uniref:Methionine aminopeptidase n=2 Tax=Sandaracinus amylolyticus TaxID=927083 RepID=A0A0F6W3J8_9BACT|nr:type I methionyl aminopeptidase [Sandaracinus amylolyticus]AKF06587.1 Methionine aminopeptidase [Sandaracinus amylolyticus]
MGSVELMTPSMLERMRASCQLASDCLLMVGEKLRAGMTTDEVNTLVHEFIVSHDAIPSPLNYKPGGAPRPFPKSVCTSVNEVVCHGIPGKRRLENGDIVNVDVTTYFRGFHGDTSATFYIGEPSAEAKLVTETARHCLELGIAQVKDGARIGDIGAAIQEYAEGRGCSVVREYVGHGVGREFHMPPQVPHYGKRGAGQRIRAGMVFTIEPMINVGHFETEMLDDQWTVVTRDRSLSAQFEHTVLVTRTGCEVLTHRRGVLRSSEDKPWTSVGPLSTRAAFEARHPSPAGT